MAFKNGSWSQMHPRESDAYADCILTYKLGATICLHTTFGLVVPISQVQYFLFHKYIHKLVYNGR
jgi:hypothetical protein